MTISLHPVVQHAYSGVHRWLKRRDDAASYTNIDERKISKRLSWKDMKHIAAQFNVLFPAHHFKTLDTLQNIIERKVLLNWLQSNPYVTLIDVGCGAGAATSALISTVLHLQSHGHLDNGLQIACVGVDPVANALGLYYQLISRIKNQIDAASINLDIRIVDRPVSESVTDLDEHLGDILNQWDQPSLSRVFLIQSNIVSPLGELFADQESRREELSGLGIPLQAYVSEDRFGTREARSYHQLFSQVPIDNLHVITVGTDSEELLQSVQDMGNSIGKIFAPHKPVLVARGAKTIDFVNPHDGYWNKKRSRHMAEDKTFGYDVQFLENKGHSGDQNWHDVIARRNLLIAWVRVRAIHKREAISDDMEIRLFECDLDGNLERLHQGLKHYDSYTARTNDRLLFDFPKNEDTARPYVLSRIEEDVLSVATIQVLGNRAFGLQSSSYAYRPHRQSASSTEFLYEYWFDAYRRFKSAIRNTAERNPDCRVLRVDIESYYSNIPQSRLLSAVSAELRNQSKRIDWLLHKLLCTSALDPVRHYSKHGLSQGGAGSGFYANTYLASLDAHLGVIHGGEVESHRFVDDIVMIIRNPDDLDRIEKNLVESLEDLGLALNAGKRECYSQAEYLLLPDHDDELDDLSDSLLYFTNCLWFTNGSYQSDLLKEGNWWKFIDTYRERLRSLSIFIESDRLSRKLHQYLISTKRNRDLRNKRVGTLIFPPIHSQYWKSDFLHMNPSWTDDRDSLRDRIVSLLKESHVNLTVTEDPREKRRLATRIYFSANRLARLGFNGTEDVITEILCRQPWIVRQPQHVFRGLALQGYVTQLNQILETYIASDYPAASFYVSLVLHAFRFLEIVPDSVTESIVEFSINTARDEIERLMATETWLHLGLAPNRGICKTIEAFLNDATSPRLQKNYVLLLGKLDRESIRPFETGDYLLQTAFRLAQLDRVGEIFADIEPEIIRREFYSDEYPDGPREYSEMGYF